MKIGWSERVRDDGRGKDTYCWLGWVPEPIGGYAKGQVIIAISENFDTSYYVNITPPHDRVADYDFRSMSFALVDDAIKWGEEEVQQFLGA